MAEQLGLLIGQLLTPLLVLLFIGLIQFFRTGSIEKARQAAFSLWALAIAVILFILSLVGRFAQNF